MRLDVKEPASAAEVSEFTEVSSTSIGNQHIDVPPQLRLRNIDKTYVVKDGPVLSGIDLDVAEGELVTLLGPSGCGKSTLLRIVAGFIDPSAGTVTLGGQDITATATHRRNVGIVHQSHALWPHLTVVENVAFGLEMRRVRRAERERRASEMLELVGLDGYGRRLPGELSGGQQQRVALARALVIQPRVLLLDEPLSSLDANLRVYLREEIRRLQRELAVTTLFVTHDREEAMAISDRIVVLDGGRIAQIGPAIDLYRSPASRFVMNFTGATVEFEGVVRSVDNEAAVVESPLGMTRVAVHAPLEVGAMVCLAVRPDDLRLATADDDPASTISGELVDAAFLGTSVEMRTEINTVNGRATIPIRLPTRQFDFLPPPGSLIRLAIDDDHIHLFTEIPNTTPQPADATHRPDPGASK